MVGWLGEQGLLGRDRLVVEIGCGAGDVLRALSPKVEAVVGLDASALMCAEARDRTRGLDNVVVLQTAGPDLSILDDASADLVIAVDSFPRLVGAGLAEAHVREAARVLVPGGVLAIFNWNGPERADQQIKHFEAAAQAAGFPPTCVGKQTLSRSDRLVFTARLA